MPEPLILKVQADTKGVPEGFNKITKSAEGLDSSARRASGAVRGFVQELSQAKSGADVASAALGALGRVLGTSIAGTAIAIAGKAVIDTFTKIGDTVSQTRDRIATASEDIKKSGIDISFTQSASEAKRLSDEADNARKNIEKLDKSFLAGLVATIVGAREELGKLAKEAEDLSQQRLLEGARTERIRAEERAGLAGTQLEIMDIEERLSRELQAVDLLSPIGIKTATELRKRAEFDIAQIRKREAVKIDVSEARQKLKLIDAQIAGEAEANKIARDFNSRRSEEEKKIQNELLKERERLQEEITKKTKEAEKEALDMRIKGLDLEERLIEQRRRVIQAEGRVAEEVSRFGGTGRAQGARPTSFEIGAQRRAEKAAQDEAFKLRQQERMRIRGEIETARGNVYDPDTGRLIRGTQASGFDINRRLSEMMDDAAREQQRQVYDDAKNARAGAQATEETLKSVKDNLQKVLDELKTYAHAT